jgi:UDP-glucose 4-epimerase
MLSNTTFSYRKRILVTGGAGFIGSHTCIALFEANYVPVIIDNFSNSSPEVLNRLAQIVGRNIECHQLDLNDHTAVDALLKDGNFDAVIHFAGLKAVGDSVSQPLNYYANNVGSTIALLQAAAKYKLYKFIFSSSATVYGSQAKSPILENADIKPNNPYGSTKAMIERVLEDLTKSSPEWKVISLRYFNPVGAHPSGKIGEDPKGIPNNLMPFISQTAVGKLPSLRVFGNDYDTLDGTGIRDYIHVMDLACGHVCALNAINRLEERYLPINLGTGEGKSVLQVVDAFQKACKKSIPVTFSQRRSGDAAITYASVASAHKLLGWKATKTLDDMCNDAWHWQSHNPNGYASVA